jgi:hypothetical protein
MEHPSSSVARLQQWLMLVPVMVVLIALAAVVGWVPVPRRAVLWWAVAVLLYSPTLLAIQFLLAANVNRLSGQRVTTGWRGVRAWMLEVVRATRIFGWQQPWRWRLWPDASSLPSQQANAALTPLQSTSTRSRRGAVLVHGFMCNRGIWNDWRPTLEQLGHPVVAVNLEPMLGSIDDYAFTIEQAVAHLWAMTGQPPIIAAHSMGGLAVRAWMRAYADAEQRIQHVVTIGTPHHGTWLARWGAGENARQMQYQSPWLQELAAGEPTNRYARFTCWHSCGDNIVFPYGTAVLPGARVCHLPDVGHVAMLREKPVLDELVVLLQQ